MKYYYKYKTSIGDMCIAEDDGRIYQMDIDMVPEDADLKETELIRKTAAELDEYLDGKRRYFDVPIEPKGTAFQQKVWEALRKIPYGETATYKDIAVAVGNPKACRAVGGANNRNRILIMIPCHRVIGTDGSMTGFGAGIDVKIKLLSLEKQYK